MDISYKIKLSSIPPPTNEGYARKISLPSSTRALRFVARPTSFAQILPFPSNTCQAGDVKVKGTRFRVIEKDLASFSPLFLTQLKYPNVSTSLIANQLSKLTDVKSGKRLYAGDLKLLVDTIGLLSQRGPGNSSSNESQSTSQTFVKVRNDDVKRVMYSKGGIRVNR